MELKSKILKRKQKALKENNEAALIAACIDLSEYYKKEERFTDAISEYKLLENIHKKRKNVIEIATVNRGIGEAYMLLNDYGKAIEHQKIYLGLSRQQENKLEEQRALATLGHTFLTKFIAEKSDRNDLNLAHKYTMKSLSVCERLDVNKYELVDMTARLYNNLGVIEEFRGNPDKSVELFKKAIVLCKANDVYASLFQAYNSMASILEKKSEYNGAIQNYNLAFETAKKLKDKSPVLLGECLINKSIILLKIGDIYAAKKTLHKAYKLKNVDQLKREIAKKLKIVVNLHRAEKELIGASSEIDLQKCYEKIGDGFSSLGCYEKALEYYKKMEEIALKTNVDLSSTFYSLAVTFRDDEQFEKSLEYFDKQYSIISADLKEGLDTLCEIADTREMANYPISDIISIYEKAIENCRKESNSREEGRMIKRLIEYLQRHHGNCEIYQNRLEEIGFEPSDSESFENKDGESESSLANITSSDGETDDSDLGNKTQRLRRRPKTFQIRRNLRGETKLHTASITGKLNVVKLLIEEGHPVNVRDNSGWLPLHDACVNGHYDIVQVLIDRGAAVNDRGGTHCNGITPLHDAAVNGHLGIIELLLKNGASVLAKTDEGETPYHYLRKVMLENENEVGFDKKKCEELLETMGAILDKAGISREIDTSVKNSAFITGAGNSDETVVGRRRIVREKSRSCSSSSGGNNSDYEGKILKKKTLEISKSSGANEYKMVMESLRKKSGELPSKSPVKNAPKRSAFVLSDEIIDDDWLEDDLNRSQKKRRISSNSTTSSLLQTNSIRNGGLKKFNSFEILDNDDGDDDLETIRNVKQTSLLDSDFGFSKNVTQTSSTLPISTSQRNSFKKKGIQPKITHFGCEKTPEKKRRSRGTPSPSPQKFLDDDPILAMDVNVEGRLFRVTTKMSLKNTLTVKWLALETSRRYAKKEYVEPVLELATKSGAELVDDDLIGTLFVTDSQVVEINAKVLKWKLPPIQDRYKEACGDMELPPLKLICDKLESVTISLDLKNCGIKPVAMAPLCKSLLRESRLVELNLTNNFLNVDSIKLLSSSLNTLENLVKLNLTCTNLHVDGLRILVKSFEGLRIQSLDLSQNFLGNESLGEISRIPEHLKHLKEFNLSMCDFTKIHQNLQLEFGDLELFNLSWNSLGNDCLIILKCINLKNLNCLDFSNVDAPNGFLNEFVECFNGIRANFNYLNLSRCNVDDSEVFNLIRICDKLETFNLSYNNITALTLRRLLGFQNVDNLILLNCDKINDYFDESESLWAIENKFPHRKTLKITCDAKKFHILIKLWETTYNGNFEVETNDGLLILK